MSVNHNSLAERINTGLYQETDVSVFTTAVLGRLDAQSRTCTCGNAGHRPVIVLDSTGREKARLQSGGLPHATLDTTPFTANEPVALEDGDLLFLYTDGLTEAHRGEESQFGLDRAIQVVRDNQHRTAAEIVEAVHDAACESIVPRKPKDDITVVVVKVNAGFSEASSSGVMLTARNARLSVSEHFDRTTDVIDYPSFAAEPCDDVLIVRFVDTRYFDTEQYAQLQQDLIELVERQQPHNLLVDFGNIVYCSSALISALLMAQKRVQAASGTMRLFGLTQPVLESLQHLNLIDTLLSVYADEREARNSCDC